MSRTFALRLPASIKRAAEDLARRDGVSLNQFIATAVAEKVSALDTADYFRRRAARGRTRRPGVVRSDARPPRLPPAAGGRRDRRMKNGWSR